MRHRRHVLKAVQTSGEVRFRRDGDRLAVDHATPVMWFPRHVLEQCVEDPEVGLSFDGTSVTLRASNGQWIWKLTGRTCLGRLALDAEAVVMVEGVWPD